MITKAEKKTVFIIAICLAIGFVSRHFSLRKKIFHPSGRRAASLSMPGSANSQPSPGLSNTDTVQMILPEKQRIIMKNTHLNVQRPISPLNLNTASAPELQRIKGIGPKLASAIIEFRKVNGPFQQLTHLMRVKGIGDKKMKKFAPFLEVD